MARAFLGWFAWAVAVNMAVLGGMAAAMAVESVRMWVQSIKQWRKQ